MYVIELTRVYMFANHVMPREARGQHSGIACLLFLCGSERLNSDHQTCWQSPFPAEPAILPALIMHSQEK